MEPFATAVDRTLANKATNPNQISNAANNLLAMRGIRNPGGLLKSTEEKMTIEAFHLIFDAAMEERSRRVEQDQSALREEVVGYLTAKFQPLLDHANHVAGPLKATANASASKLLLKAAMP